MEPFHLANRRRLAALLPAGSMAVIATGPWPLTSGVDSAAPWPDFFYLTGLREPGCALVVTSAQGVGGFRSILFAPPRDSRTNLWEGPMEPPDGHADLRSAAEFESVLRALAHQAGTVFVFAAENPCAPSEDDRLARQVRRLLPLHPLDRLAPLLGRLRASKQPWEIAAVRAAGELASRALRRAIGFVRPGVRGYEVKAEFLHEVTRHGSAGLGCPAITAAGTETLTLHWRGDRRPWADGEVALLDFTCEWNGLCADIARTIPVGGKFSPRHRAVHDAVARTLRAAPSLLKPGRLPGECETDIELLIQGELLRLGILKSSEVRDPAQPSPALRRHFMHRALHHIGIEVHDPVPADVPLAEGQVLAVEPAIYLPAEGFGIRLENNFVIGPDGGECLAGDLPLEAADIESLLLI